MNDILQENYKKVFNGGNKENIMDFIKKVETDNYFELSSMIHDDFEQMFELENLLLKLQKAMNKQECYQEDSILLNDNIDEIKDVIQKIKFKLLTIDKQKQKHQLMIDECFSDTKLVFHVLNANQEVIQ